MIQHRVKLTDDTPIRCKPYSLTYAMREELRNEGNSMLKVGVVRPSTSPYALPIVIFKKMTKINLTKGYWLIPVAQRLWLQMDNNEFFGCHLEW